VCGVAGAICPLWGNLSHFSGTIRGLTCADSRPLRDHLPGSAAGPEADLLADPRTDRRHGLASFDRAVALAGSAPVAERSYPQSG
jgi:hypothetical protein